MKREQHLLVLLLTVPAILVVYFFMGPSPALILGAGLALGVLVWYISSRIREPSASEKENGGQHSETDSQNFQKQP